MMRHNTRMVLRTIRRGRVKINHKWFYVGEKWMKYDGRLDGLRYAFGLYWTGEELQSYISLWGTEEMYHDIDAGYGPELIDGGFPWSWWYELQEEQVQ